MKQTWEKQDNRKEGKMGFDLALALLFIGFFIGCAFLESVKAGIGITIFFIIVLLVFGV
jgi:hypothetical protein